MKHFAVYNDQNSVIAITTSIDSLKLKKFSKIEVIEGSFYTLEFGDMMTIATAEQVRDFINTAVLNNKDISKVTITYHK